MAGARARQLAGYFALHSASVGFTPIKSERHATSKPSRDPLRLLVLRGLETLAAEGAQFDLVLLDPPCRKGWGDTVLTRWMELNLLSGSAWVATEVSRLEAAPASLIGLDRISLATLGDHQIAVYQRQSKESAL